MADSSVSFTFSAGALVRGAVKRVLVEGAWKYGLRADVEEAKSLLESSYRITVKGAATSIQEYLKAVDAWGEANGFSK